MSRSTILANVAIDIANNNTGLIDAIHVRRNIMDLANNALMLEDVGTTANTVAAGNDSRFTTSPSNEQTNNYTLVAADAGKTVRMSSSSTRTITIPPNSSVAFPVDTIVNFETVGTGDCTIVAGSGVTIRSRNGLKLAGQYAVATAHKIATNEWILAGDLEE